MGAAFCEMGSFHWDWRLDGGVSGVLDVAVTWGFAFQAVASKLCFGDKSQPHGDFGGW